MATVVAFDAHPDDEVILTGGPLARAAARRHRVVVVTATDGRVHNGESDFRLGELRRSADILGAHRDECLGYADSGYGHRDHVQVHHVGQRAAELAGTPRVPEATMPRELLVRVGHLARMLRLPPPYEPDAALPAGVSRRDIFD